MSILKNFTVVDLVTTRSASVATLADTSLKFNNPTTAELHYTPFIQVLVNPKEKQFAIRACKEGDPNAMRFSKPKEKQKHAVKITANAIVDMIRKMAPWPADEVRCLPGIYFADEDVIIYDMNTAYVPVSKGGKKTPRKAKKSEETTI